MNNPIDGQTVTNQGMTPVEREGSSPTRDGNQRSFLCSPRDFQVALAEELETSKACGRSFSVILLDVRDPAQGRVGELAEAPYSVWNIMGLVLVMLFLMITGILMTDIVRNMWGWEEGRDVATSISEGITAAFGMR